MSKNRYQYNASALLQNKQVESNHFVISDAAFKSLPVPEAYIELFNGFQVHWVIAGEECKSLQRAKEIWHWLDTVNATRFDTLIIIGGGTTTDLGAFVASTYKRGLNFILIPTTLLGMVDAAIGGKNGINFNGIKNAIGTFTEPSKITIDTSWLKTLPKRELLNGWMELSKHALVGDELLWKELGHYTPNDPDINWDKLVKAGSSIKRKIIESDFRESGERKILNFGHTIGHALESVAAESKTPLDHGFAVGVGMIVSLHWSAHRADEAFNKSELRDASDQLKKWLINEDNGDPWRWSTSQNPSELWPFMRKDKKNTSNAVLDIQLIGIGEANWDCPLEKLDFEMVWDAAF